MEIKNGEISYYHNGQPLGVAFTDMNPNLVIYPFFEIHDKIKISIFHPKHYPNHKNLNAYND